MSTTDDNDNNKTKEGAFTGRRLRLDQLQPTIADADDVESMAKSLSMMGMINPITIAPDGDTYKVIAGRTRTAAARALGWDTVPVREADDDHDLELIELDENLTRRHETKELRGERLLRQKDLYERMNPTTRRGGKREKRQSVGLPSFAEAVAKVEGTSARTVQREVKAAEERRAGKPKERKAGKPRKAVEAETRDIAKMPNLSGIKDMIEAHGGELLVDEQPPPPEDDLLKELDALARRMQRAIHEHPELAAELLDKYRKALRDHAENLRSAVSNDLVEHRADSDR